MSRVMSEETKTFIINKHKADPDAIGLELGVTLIKANVPIAAVAQLLVTTEATVYRWMHGNSNPRPVYHVNIRRLLAILRRALRAGDAPLSGTYSQRMAAMPDLIIAHKNKPVTAGD